LFKGAEERIKPLEFSSLISTYPSNPCALFRSLTQLLCASVPQAEIEDNVTNEHSGDFVWLSSSNVNHFTDVKDLGRTVGPGICNTQLETYSISI
jgi:hypothetical protein